MARATNHTIDIISDLTYQKLTKKAKEHNTSIRSMVNDILEKKIQIDEKIGRKYSNLKIVDVENDIICIKDNKRNQVSIVQPIKEKICCSICEKESICDHIVYALISDPNIIYSKNNS